jgi:hypothetical protein
MSWNEYSYYLARVVWWAILPILFLLLIAGAR